ncbi:STAS domain-containing protein [Streptomyces sp. NPDC015220]|uniref:STAS domain-containing protein n=1 Tax=Streptomyces sp. NPDC015220 TaxID=3364947 RepID=UPI0036FD2586
MTDRTLTTARHTHPSGAVVLAVAGELDHHTAPDLTLAIQETAFSQDAPVVIDLSDLAYCDSTGITVLITAYRRAGEARTRLALAGLSADLMRVFRIVGLDQIFTFHPDVEDAIGALSS